MDMSRDLMSISKQRIFDKIAAELKELCKDKKNQLVNQDLMNDIARIAEKCLERIGGICDLSSSIEAGIKVSVHYDGEKCHVTPANLKTAALMHGFTLPSPEIVKDKTGEYWGFPNGTLWQNTKGDIFFYEDQEPLNKFPNEKEGDIKA